MVVFIGSGVMVGINWLVYFFGVVLGMMVLIGLYEYYLNILLWCESGVDVVVIFEVVIGGLDFVVLCDVLVVVLGLVIVSLFVVFNVMGIFVDVVGLIVWLKVVGVKVVWDYVGGVFYLFIDMGLGMDVVVLLLYKFIGGLGVLGVMILCCDVVMV